MLITELKSKETIASLVDGKSFMINCQGCKEVHFPEKNPWNSARSWLLTGS